MSLVDHLRARLSYRYTYLRGRLSGLLGSREHASEALHETWLRLERMSTDTPVADADAYLLRMAANIAHRQYKQSSFYLSADDITELIDFADEQANVEELVSNRLATEHLLQALQGLTVRQRAILIAARLHGERNEDIAQHYEVSVSTVQRELRIALRYCEQYMQTQHDTVFTSATGRRRARS